RGDAGQHLASIMVSAFERWPALVYLMNVPSMLVGGYLGRHSHAYSLNSDWANPIGAFLTFLWGFMIASNHDLLLLIMRRSKEFMVVGLAVATIYFTALYSGFTVHWPRTASLLFWTLVNSYYGMTWILALVGYACSTITQPSRWLTYATEAV